MFPSVSYWICSTVIIHVNYNYKKKHNYINTKTDLKTEISDNCVSRTI